MSDYTTTGGVRGQAGTSLTDTPLRLSHALDLSMLQIIMQGRACKLIHMLMPSTKVCLNSRGRNTPLHFCAVAKK